MKITKEDIHILYSQEELQTRIKSLADELNQHFNGEEVFAICVLKGSVMFFTDFAKSETKTDKLNKVNSGNE